MKKIIMLFMLLAFSLSMFSCGGGGSGSADTPKGENPGVPSVVKLSPSQYIAQTNSFIFLHAQIFDGNGSPVSGVTVTFTNLSDPFGKITSAILRTLHLHKPVGILSTTEARTDGQGIATVKITSTSSGFATIQAEVNKGAGLVRDRKTVFFTATVGTTTPPAPTLTLHVDDGDGTYDEPADFDLLKTPTDSQRTIKAVVLDGFGVPLAGRAVTFGSDSPSEVTFTPSTPVLTNSNGEAFVTLTVNPSIITNLERVLNITAGADTDNNGTIDTANMITLFLEPTPVSNVSVLATPSVVPLNGTSTISASVTLSSGGPVPDGSTVSFAATCGGVTDFAQTTNGDATATFTAPSIPPSGSCTVTATIAGVSGSTNVTVTTSLMVQPSSQTMNGVIGGTVTYQIFGGVPAYKVMSSNPAVAFNTTAGNGTWDVASSGGIFTVTVAQNTPPQSVTFTIRDQIGTTVNATLTIGSGTSLSVQPTSQTIDGVAGGDATFTIFGGAPGYSVFANTANPQLQPDPTSVAASGDAFTIHVPANTPATTIVYTIRDSLGATTTGTLQITSSTLPSLKVSPTSASIDGSIGGTTTFAIIGGSPGYTVISSNPAVPASPASVASSGDTFNVTILPGTAAQAITYTIIDQSSASVTATVTVTAPAAGGKVLILPGSVSVVSGASAQDIHFTISGGTPSYVTTSTDPANAFNNADGTGIFNGTPITVTVPANATAGDVTLNVFDSVGGTTSAKLTIIGPPGGGPAGALTVSPSAVSVAGVSGTEDQVTFLITGGSGTYTGVVSSNTAVVPNPTLSVNTFTIDPKPVSASTAVTLTVFDDAGATATATVTVTPATSSMAINPSTIAVESGDTIPYHIIGGLPPFDIFTSNSAIVNVGGSSSIHISSRSFNANVVGAGSATITVVDSDGQTVTSNVMVTLTVPDFSIACDSSVTVPTGAARTLLCSLTSLNSFSAPVTLTCPDLPAGTTCTGFNPASPVTPAANLTTSIFVTVNNASTGTGSYLFHVQGTSGLLSHTTPVTLNVP